MNKYQEALKIAYEMMNQADWGAMKIGCVQLKTLQELVDKETPVKTIKEPIIRDRYRLYKNYCPICKQELLILGNYCLHCGQKVDWSGDDE